MHPSLTPTKQQRHDIQHYRRKHHIRNLLPIFRVLYRAHHALVACPEEDADDGKDDLEKENIPGVSRVCWLEIVLSLWIPTQ